MPWRILAAILVQLGSEGAEETLREALSIEDNDIPTIVLRAMYHLGLKGGENADSALAFAVTSDTLIRSDRSVEADRRGAIQDLPRVKRALALAWLRNKQWEGALRAAEQAVAAGDQLCIAHLVMAVANGQLGNLDAACQHLLEAEATWPQELRDARFRVVTDGRSLWFDNTADLESLRDEARQMTRARNE